MSDGWSGARPRALPLPITHHPLNRFLVRLAGADAHHLLDRGDEDLSIADLAGPCRLDHRFDRGIDHALGDDDLDLHLREEVDDVLGAAIQLGVALLPAEPLDLRDREAGHPHLGERLAHLVELEWLDHRFDLLHGRHSGDPGAASIANGRVAASASPGVARLVSRPAFANNGAAMESV